MSQIDNIASHLPSLKRKLTIWAIRSVIVVAAAYAIVAMHGPAWLITVAWVYVGATLVLAFVMSWFAQRLIARSQAQNASAASEAGKPDTD
jgi:predicted Na+-dependent transporter